MNGFDNANLSRCVDSENNSVNLKKGTYYVVLQHKGVLRVAEVTPSQMR